jgi:hypothetical protein
MSQRLQGDPGNQRAARLVERVAETREPATA